MPLTGNLVTRFPNGITNVPVGDIFNELLMPDPTKYHVFLDDFDVYSAGTTWTLTTVEAGGGSATEALTAGNGGLLLLTNDVADNDLDQIQTAVANFTFTAGKKCFFKARAKINEVLQSDFCVGLVNSNSDSCTLANATDGAFFLKADGAATVNFYFRKDNSTGSTSAASVTTMVDDTFVEFAFFYDGIDRIYYAIDGAVAGYLDAGSTYFPNANVMPTLCIKQGEATNAKTCTVDYIFVAQER